MKKEKKNNVFTYYMLRRQIYAESVLNSATFTYKNRKSGMESLQQILKLSVINFVATLRIVIASNLTPNQHTLDAVCFLVLLNLQVAL